MKYNFKIMKGRIELRIGVGLYKTLCLALRIKNKVEVVEEYWGLEREVFRNSCCY